MWGLDSGVVLGADQPTHALEWGPPQWKGCTGPVPTAGQGCAGHLTAMAVGMVPALSHCRYLN